MDTKSLLILRCLLLDGLIETLYIASLDRFSSNPICSLFLEEAWFDRSHPVSTVEIIGIINGRVGGELERLWIEKQARSRNFELTSTLFESLRRGNSFRAVGYTRDRVKSIFERFVSVATLNRQLGYLNNIECLTSHWICIPS